MRSIQPLILSSIVLVSAMLILLGGCGAGGTRAGAVVVDENLGIICVGPGVEAVQAKALNAIDAAAKAQGLTRVSDEAMGRVELSRAAYVFEDGTGAVVRVDFIDREEADLRILVSADRKWRLNFTAEIWRRLSPQLR